MKVSKWKWQPCVHVFQEVKHPGMILQLKNTCESEIKAINNNKSKRDRTKNAETVFSGERIFSERFTF